MQFLNCHTKNLFTLFVLWMLLTPVLAQAGSSKPTPEVIALWDGEAPGTDKTIGPERTSQSIGPVGEILVINDVTKPTLTVFRPAPDKANGAAMIVLPGGAFAGLAWDVEGTEVAEWLTERGVTAFLLKYRVHPFPVSPQEFAHLTVEDVLDLLKPAWKIAVMDAEKAVNVVRAKASEFQIDPAKIGMIGFSAGAATTMGVLLETKAQLNFAAPIYGMSMSDHPIVPDTAPPIFIAVAQDDSTVPYSKSLDIYRLWAEAKRPAELHLYEKGSHGFGMRKRGLPVDNWTQALEAWLRSHGVLR